VARIRSGLPAGIVVTGSAYDGVGIPDCVRAAGEAAERVAEHLAGTKETVR
jgi:oxygen-dependent protoporphyrinogen oxidase